MDEQTTLKLMSQLVKQVINRYATGRAIAPEQRDEMAERVAEAAWEGLIVMLRQSFAEGQGVMLEHLGSFQKHKGQWLFMPAASLVEADAASLSEEEAPEMLARQALFYLTEGTEILDRLPKDLALEPQTRVRTVGELRRLIMGGEVALGLLSDEVRGLAMRLRRLADRLTGAAEEPAPYASAGPLYGEVLYTPSGPPTKTAQRVKFYQRNKTSVDPTHIKFGSILGDIGRPSLGSEENPIRRAVDEAFKRRAEGREQEPNLGAENT